MSKTEVLNDFNIDLSDPGAEKSGEYLEDLIFRRAVKLIEEDRAGVIEAFCEWISLREEPYTMIAVRIAGKLRIRELLSDIEKLKIDIESKKTFLPFYIKWVDAAIAAMKKVRPG